MGVYALCAQVRPGITPKLFYRTAMETSTELTRSGEEGGPEFTFHVINSAELVEALRKGA